MSYQAANWSPNIEYGYCVWGNEYSGEAAAATRPKDNKNNDWKPHDEVE